MNHICWSLVGAILLLHWNLRLHLEDWVVLGILCIIWFLETLYEYPLASENGSANALLSECPQGHFLVLVLTLSAGHLCVCLYWGLGKCLLFSHVWFLFCCVSVPDSVSWELSTKLLFIVLDSKAPKSEDIDEEDDDVPGRHIHTFMSTQYLHILINSFKYVSFDVIILLTW